MASTERRRPGDLGPTGQEVAENVRRLRTARGLSTTQLAKMLGDGGRPITSTSITKVEKGTRRVDVDDLMALAVALGVNPSALLLPHDARGFTEITGADVLGRTLTSREAAYAEAFPERPEGSLPGRYVWAWADGRRPLRVPDDDDGHAAADFISNSRPRGLGRVTTVDDVRQALAAHSAGAADELADDPPESER